MKIQTFCKTNLVTLTMVSSLVYGAEFTNDNQVYQVEVDLYAKVATPQTLKVDIGIVATKAGFNILRVGATVNELPIQVPSGNLINHKVFPVVKNKRFDNYAVVLDSIIVKISDKSIPKLDELFVNLAGDLTKISHSSSGLIFFKVENNTLDNLLHLKQKLEKIQAVKWVSLEILEHEMEPE